MANNENDGTSAGMFKPDLGDDNPTPEADSVEKVAENKPEDSMQGVSMQLDLAADLAAPESSAPSAPSAVQISLSENVEAPAAEGNIPGFTPEDIDRPAVAENSPAAEAAQPVSAQPSTGQPISNEEHLGVTTVKPAPIDTSASRPRSATPPQLAAQTGDALPLDYRSRDFGFDNSSMATNQGGTLTVTASQASQVLGSRIPRAKYAIYAIFGLGAIAAAYILLQDPSVDIATEPSIPTEPSKEGSPAKNELTGLAARNIAAGGSSDENEPGTGESDVVNPYWQLPNYTPPKGTEETRRTWSKQEQDLWYGSLRSRFNYQHLRAVQEVRKYALLGSEDILWRSLSDKKFWTRMSAASGLAEMGFALKIPTIERAIGATRDDLVARYFLRFKKQVTSGELYVLRQSIRLVSAEARYNILQVFAQTKGHLRNIYFTAATHDPGVGIQEYAKWTLQNTKISDADMQTYEQIVAGEVECPEEWLTPHESITSDPLLSMPSTIESEVLRATQFNKHKTQVIKDLKKAGHNLEEALKDATEKIQDVAGQGVSKLTADADKPAVDKPTAAQAPATKANVGTNSDAAPKTVKFYNGIKTEKLNEEGMVDDGFNDLKVIEIKK